MLEENAIVLGAGFQGICVALGLSRKGYRVTLVDQAKDCMRRASLRNEGKIHLGFVYAGDSSMRTSELMLAAALEFAPLVESWLGTRVPWTHLMSRPFIYCIAADSLLSREELERHYALVEDRYQEARRDAGCSYLGLKPQRLWWPVGSETTLPMLSRNYATPFAETEEVALDLNRFSELLRWSTRGERLLGCRYGHRVCSVERRSWGFRVRGVNDDGVGWLLDGSLVVNCLWEGRLVIDESMGMPPERPWVHRLKYRVVGRLPAPLLELPAMTFVLGPYGDIVTYPDGRTYLSYYPECLAGWSEELEPPREWEAACDGRVDSEVAGEVAERVLKKLELAVPGIGRTRVELVDAGAIFAWGSSDIDDPLSDLHERYDVGLRGADGYFSIDTGKFTSAPLFAHQFLEELVGAKR